MKFTKNFFAVLMAAIVLFVPPSFAKSEEQKHQEKLTKLRLRLAKEREKRQRQNAELRIKAQIVNERFYAEQPELREKFNLSCPFGGEENVIIHDALRREYIYWRGGGAMKVIMRRPVYVHRVKNGYDNLTVNITNGGERVVSNLCPGGSITLAQSLSPIVGGWQRQVVWTAEAMVDGRLAYDESSPGSLNQWDAQWEPQKNRFTWVIRFSRVDQSF